MHNSYLLLILLLNRLLYLLQLYVLKNKNNIGNVLIRNAITHYLIQFRNKYFSITEHDLFYFMLFYFSL